MNDNLKKVIELANQLQEAVNECDGVLSVGINPKGDILPSGVHVQNQLACDLDGMEFSGQDMYGTKWFRTQRYGVPVYSLVTGGESQ